MLTFTLTFPRYRDVFGAPKNYEDIVSMLQGFRRQECLVLLAKINTILNNETWYRAEVQDYLKNILFRPHTLTKVVEAEKRLAAPVIFSELQILNLAKLSILHCSDTTGSILETDEDREQLGLCCLVMNELIVTGTQGINNLSRQEKRDYLIQELIRNMAFQAEKRFDYALTRYHEIMFDIPNQLTEDSDHMDIPLVFYQITGLELPEFFSLGFSVLARWLDMKIGTVANHPDFFLNEDTWFKDTKIDPERARKIFDFIRLPLEPYREEMDREMKDLRPGEKWQYSHLTIERYPLLQLAGMDICLSLRFLQKKITENVFWVINDVLKDRQRSEKFRRFFGKVFQEYVRRLLRRCFGDRCLELRYGKSNAEASDAIVVYPNDLILFEAKSSRLFLSTSRSGNLDEYKRNLRDVLIGASQQLDRVIKDFVSGAFAVPGLRRSEFNRFHPIIVTVHSFPQEPLTWELFEDILDQNGLFRHKTIARPHLIDVEELEMLEGVLEDKDLLGLLNDKNGDRQLRDVPFKNYLSRRFKGEIPRNRHLAERYNQLGKEITKRFFGTQTDSTQPPA